MPIMRGSPGEGWIEDLVECYQRTDNPLYAWLALCEALQLKLELPQPAARYLIDSIEKLMRLTDESATRRGAEVAKIFGLSLPKGQSSPFLEFAARERDENIAIDARSELRGRTRTKAKEVLARRYDVSVREVERVLADYKSLVDEPVTVVKIIEEG